MAHLQTLPNNRGGERADRLRPETSLNREIAENRGRLASEAGIGSGRDWGRHRRNIARSAQFQFTFLRDVSWVGETCFRVGINAAVGLLATVVALTAQRLWPAGVIPAAAFYARFGRT
jgi:hypothetical protein